MLVAEHGFFLLVGKERIDGAVGVRSCPFADAAAAHKHLGLKQELALAGFALHVVDSIAVLHVGVEPENHGIFLADCANHPAETPHSNLMPSDSARSLDTERMRTLI